MTDRAIFNRKYTSFVSGSGTSVFLINGAGVTTQLSPTQSFTAGETLIQGAFVYVSGTSVFKASSLSGLASSRYAVIGATAAAANVGNSVEVNLDSVVVLSASNITAETSLIPGQVYYLSKYSGQVTRFSTTSGQVSNSGTFQYQVSAPVGQALSTTELEIEIQPPIILYS
jgi:hypothetical protein